MARSVSTAKLLAAFADNTAVLVSRVVLSSKHKMLPPKQKRVFDKNTPVSSRRNYSSQGVILNAARGRKRGVMKQGEEKQMKEGGKCSWMPDPVTGHYVPEDRVGDIDAAELREILLNHRSKEGSQV